MNKNYCKDCNKELSDYRAKRCLSCAKKQYYSINRPWNFKGGNPHCIDCKKEISYNCLRCYKCNKIKQKRPENFCIDCLKKGIKMKISSKAKRCRKHANQKAIKLIVKNRKLYKGKNNPMFGKKHTKETKEKIRKKAKLRTGRKNGFFGKILKPSWGIYKGIWMRSNWEILFALFLELSGYKWKYEPKTFDLGNTTYTPDFYLPQFDCYVEIKGYVSDLFKKKIKLFKRIHPQINIKILRKMELQKIGILE